MEALLVALGWRELVALGSEFRQQRLLLLDWACGVLDRLPPGPQKDRLEQVALQLPMDFGSGSRPALAAR
jgi:hypothetical protein